MNRHGWRDRLQRAEHRETGVIRVSGFSAEAAVRQSADHLNLYSAHIKPSLAHRSFTEGLIACMHLHHHHDSKVNVFIVNT